MLLCSSWHISLHTAPFHAHDISKCSPGDALHFVPLCHVYLSSYWCLKHRYRSAIWWLLLSVNRTWCFVIFVAFDVCLLWAWSLHVFWTMPCLIYRGDCHVFLWFMWWLEQACKLGFVMLLISVPVLLLFWCHVNLMLQRDPCLFWDTSVRMFWTYGYALSSHAPVWNYGVV